MRQSFLYVLSEYGMIGLVAEDILAELDEGLGGARDVSVALPREPDIDVDGDRKGDRTDARRPPVSLVIRSAC